MELIKASREDIPTVVSIYESVKRGEFSVWSETYPTEREALADYEAGCLYVLKEGADFIGCGSVEPVAEDDDLPFWRVNDGTHKEVSRVAVSPAYQGRGYARVLMELMIKELRSLGVRSVHLLAAKRNIPAVRTYRSLGFEFVGECFRYGADYYACELVL